jgi:sulfatase maturation enzyme AslB (radical SAM superfamily)
VEARKLKHLTTKPCPKCGVRIEKSGGCPVRNYYHNQHERSLSITLSSFIYLRST